MIKSSLKEKISHVLKPNTQSTKKKKDGDSFVIRIPRFKNFSLNMFLVLVIVVFAFFLGMLTNKVFDLEKQVSGTGTAAQANTAAGAPSAIPSPAGPVNVSVGNYPPRGNTSAKVTVIEFADLRCPFCEEWFQNIEPNLMKDYVDTGKVKFYFRNYAFLGPASTLAAEAGECANDQNQFWAFHDYMYQHQPSETDTSMYTDDNLTQIAGNLGMDTSKFSSCLTSKGAAQKVAKDLSEGQAAGVSGTPTTFINGVAVVGAVPYSQIKAAIDNDLK